ncbi:MAG: 30S ribosome-binding factor RbfA [candidate division WOR-3 bacterium]|nr:30S ribosome-binding factor RbfA [candidate division WOR-3 bacterium]MCX7757817.1 30S ribosome-binding factor RbfA [candidate division WOR-3 bacterium]MDW7987094.1 30S ribosome-binding factor RbfA [candidate division WOR-3 bacterium]
MPYRNEKIAETIKCAVAEIILTDLQDPVFHFVTITGIKLSSDLRQATLYFYNFDEKVNNNIVLAHLNHAANFIRNRLKEKIITRYIPQLNFKLDELVLEEKKLSNAFRRIQNPNSSNGI